MKLRLLLVMLLGAGAAYFALFGGDYGYFEVRKLNKQREEQAAQLKRLQFEVDSLRARTDSLENDSATIERTAREKFGLIRKGERLYRFVDSLPKSDTSNTGTTTR